MHAWVDDPHARMKPDETARGRVPQSDIREITRPVGAPTAYRFDEFELRPAHFELLRRGTPVAVEPKTLEFLMTLIENRSRAVPRAELLERHWADGAVTPQAVSQCAFAARRVLGDTARDNRFIRTRYRRGYQFVYADVELVFSDDPAPPIALTALRSPRVPRVDGTDASERYALAFVAAARGHNQRAEQLLAELFSEQRHHGGEREQLLAECAWLHALAKRAEPGTRERVARLGRDARCRAVGAGQLDLARFLDELMLGL